MESCLLNQHKEWQDILDHNVSQLLLRQILLVVIRNPNRHSSDEAVNRRELSTAEDRFIISPAFDALEPSLDEG